MGGGAKSMACDAAGSTAGDRAPEPGEQEERELDADRLPGVDGKRGGGCCGCYCRRWRVPAAAAAGAGPGPAGRQPAGAAAGRSPQLRMPSSFLALYDDGLREEAVEDSKGEEEEEADPIARALADSRAARARQVGAPRSSPSPRPTTESPHTLRILEIVHFGTGRECTQTVLERALEVCGAPPHAVHTPPGGGAIVAASAIWSMMSSCLAP